MSDTPKRFTKPVAIMTVIGALIASISALNAFTGLNFRPAWGYEIEQSITSDKQTQVLLNQVIDQQNVLTKDILEMQKVQYEIRLGLIDRQKWELRSELATHQANTKSYRNNSASVPRWLQNLVSTTEIAIQKLDKERNQIERKLQEHTSYLEAAE